MSCITLHIDVDSDMMLHVTVKKTVKRNNDSAAQYSSSWQPLIAYDRGNNSHLSNVRTSNISTKIHLWSNTFLNCAWKIGMRSAEIAINR